MLRNLETHQTLTAQLPSIDKADPVPLRLCFRSVFLISAAAVATSQTPQAKQSDADGRCNLTLE